ncbi:MAG TPA: hypothetical protein VFR62_03105, partial [Gemmatimonadales bacterium]|nr:hypothetical protein [Gemmatimonadales bacterium]
MRVFRTRFHALLPFAAALLAVAVTSLLERAPAGRADTILLLQLEKTGYLAGDPVQLAATGFVPGELVTFQVTHTGGGAEPGMGHEPWTATADATGVVTGTWLIDRMDAGGHSFSATAAGEASGAAPPAAFRRIAVIATDKLDYQPEETAAISGSGFRPFETVTLQVVHLSALIGGNGHEPFTATADENGVVSAGWFVDPDDSLGAIFQLSALGGESGLSASTIFYDAFVTVVDDGGADDVGGQSQRDLNLLSVDRVNLPNALGVVWNWDNTGFSGGNTGDACSLYDTDNDGLANFALCVVVDENPAAYVSTRLYS